MSGQQMNYECSIRFQTEHPGEMLSILQHEQEDRERTKLAITQGSKQITFAISAADVTALKTEFNRVLKALTVIEKAEKLS
ncbi:MAG: hypothetical protein Q7S65_01770 [Nanoarchaeota archaeon]|nr:hypothetical protein [Nanoarchaeota archaeon]